MRRFYNFVCSIIALLFAVLVSGCGDPNEDKMNYSAFYAEEDQWGEHTIAEKIIATAEFSDYSEDVQVTKVIIENNSDDVFFVIADLFTLQQFCDGEWKYLNFIGFTSGDRWYRIEPGEARSRNIHLDGNIVTPLPKGKYRIGVGNIDFEAPAYVAYAEFDIV